MTFVQDRPAQSTPAPRHLPAVRAARFLLVTGVIGCLVSGSLRAQQTVTVRRAAEPFLGDIGGPRLGQITEGSSFTAGPARSSFTQITLEGWVFKPSVQSVRREGHTLSINHGPVENLRDAPNGKVIAQLVQGFLLDQVEQRGQWVKVRRSVWVATAALRGPEVAATTRPAPAPAASKPPAPAPSVVPASVPARPGPSVQEPPQAIDPRRGVVRRRMQLYRAPDSTAIGQLEAGTPVRVIARAGGWVRVEAQAWVRESEVRPSDAGVLTGVSAAELRGAPEEFKGKLLRWTIQYLSLQTADELRPDFQPGQKYILARGPAPEYAFVYITVPDVKLAEVQRLEPLASVTIVARVTNGRSTYLANPILELVELP